MNKKMGRLIVLEGVDDVGKSTIAVQLVAELSALRPAKILAFPGNTVGTIGKWVYDFHHDPSRLDANQTALQLLHVAAHIDCIESEIVPLLESGFDVVLDRYWWSTYVYGVAGGVPKPLLDKMIDLELFVWGSNRPDVIVFVRRKDAELAANPRLVVEYENLFRAQSGVHSRAVMIWNDSNVQTAVSQILIALN